MSKKDFLTFAIFMSIANDGHVHKKIKKINQQYQLYIKYKYLKGKIFMQKWYITVKIEFQNKFLKKVLFSIFFKNDALKIIDFGFLESRHSQRKKQGYLKF